MPRPRIMVRSFQYKVHVRNTAVDLVVILHLRIRGWADLVVILVEVEAACPACKCEIMFLQYLAREK
jgi:hypothetical protein